MLSTISKMAAVVAMGFALTSAALADDASPNTPNTPNKGKVSKVDTQAQGQTQSQSQTQASKVDAKVGNTQISKGSGDSKGSGAPVSVKGDKGQVQSQGQAQTQSQSQTQSPIITKGQDQGASKISKGSGEDKPLVNTKGGKLDKASKKPTDN